MKAGSEATRGMLFAVAAHGLWGFAPVYWKLLRAPPALAWLARLAAGGEMTLPRESLGVKALVAGAGVITAAPLLCFTSAARRLPLSTLGFFQ